MAEPQVPVVRIIKTELYSKYLNRLVTIDFYLPVQPPGYSQLPLLLINDGQDLRKMAFGEILNRVWVNKTVAPLLCAAIHCGADRKMEYGVSGYPDFKGRGARAKNYSSFLFTEFLPFVYQFFNTPGFKEKSFAGFSLGGLNALSNVWNYPHEFSKAGIFSGSLWWRSLDQHEKGYDDNKHRIMHQLIRKGMYQPGLKFFFQCGNMDETKDRNNNGVIDSIDDTQDLIKELKAKGYSDADVHYKEISDGRHDVPTWARAFPDFLKWGWGLNNK
jgi:enterochelin esterase-like enzyme